MRIGCPELCGDKTKPDPGSEGSTGSAHSGRAIVSWTHWVLILASGSNKHFLFEGQGPGLMRPTVDREGKEKRVGGIWTRALAESTEGPSVLFPGHLQALFCFVCFTYVYLQRACTPSHRTQAEVRGQLSFHHVFPGWNSGCQAWWQASLPVEPSSQPLF